MNYPLIRLKELLEVVSRREAVTPEKEYRILGAHWYAKGLYIKAIEPGTNIQAQHLFRVEEGDFVYNRLFAWKGSFAVVLKGQDGCYVSGEFPSFCVNQDRLNARYLWLYFSQEKAWNTALGLSTGGTPTTVSYTHLDVYKRQR